MSAASAAHAQRALAFEPLAAAGAGDFHVGAANREAAAWIEAWPRWPAPGLAVYGPPGCGKSHLLAVWARRAQAAVVEARNLRRALPGLLAGARAAAIDGAGPGVDERALLHLYNAIAARRGSLLLSATAPPAEWPVALPDLRSRLRALPAVAIAEPDDDLLAAVLVKLFADRQTAVAPAPIGYLVGRMERSFAAARRTVALLDRAACERRRAVTVPFVREILPSGEAEGPAKGD